MGKSKGVGVVERWEGEGNERHRFDVIKGRWIVIMWDVERERERERDRVKYIWHMSYR